MKVVLRNQTGIEDWVHEKAAYRREGTDEPPFLHPYNLGWRENFAQVINWSLQPIGDGITWKVREKCHPYAFTVRFTVLCPDSEIFKIIFFIIDRAN